MRLRAHDDVAAVHQDHLVAAPFRIDLDDPGRKRMEADGRGHNGADRDVEVDVGGLLDLLRLDGGDDLGALLGRRSRGRRSGGVARRGLRLLSVAGSWSVATRSSEFVVPLLLSRPSAFMSLPPLVSVSELMLFDFSPWRLGVLRALAGRHLLVRFRCLHPDEAGAFGARWIQRPSCRKRRYRGSSCPTQRRRETGAVCCAVGTCRRCLAARAGALRIRKAGSGDQCRYRGRNQKAIGHKVLLTWMHCPHRQQKEMCDVPVLSRFHRVCFVNA